jgi:hypothetical protein
MNISERENARIAAMISFFLSENSGAGRTQIVKFLYLTDLEYRQYQGRQVTNLEYIWGDFGPFDQRIYDILDSMKSQGIVVEEEYVNNYGKPAFRYELLAPCNRDSLHRAEVEIAKYVAKQVRDTPLRTLLDDVVYQTTPMIDAIDRRARGQKLRMELVDLQKRKFGIDLEQAWEADESLDREKAIPAETIFNELLMQCPN